MAGRRFTVSGRGLLHRGPHPHHRRRRRCPTRVEDTLLAMALCTDSELRDGEVVGDPTEGALLVLAEKGGIDTAALRRDKPRVARGAVRLRLQVHGHLPPLDRPRRPGRGALLHQGRPGRAGRPRRPLPRRHRDPRPRRRHSASATRGANAELAGQGMRVLAVGAQDFTAADRRGRRRPEGPARPGRARRAGRHRRPAPSRGPRGHRRVPRRRHPGPDDHRRPRRHRRGHRGRPRHPRRGGHRRGPGPDRPTTPISPAGSTTSGWSPGSPPSTRSASCARCRAAATSWR